PYVLGISGGASVTGTIAIVLGAGAGVLGGWAVPVASFAGAVSATVVVFSFGRVRGRLVPNVALLAGVVLNALAGSLILAVRVVASPQAMHEALYWLTGALTAVDATRLLAVFFYSAIGLGLLYSQAVAMNAFA